MYRVLMPIDNDGSRTAAQVRAAASLPHADESVEVTLLHVFDDKEVAENTAVAQLTAGSDAEEALTDAGVAVESATTHGDPAEKILQTAEEIDADLIVLGGRKRSPLGSLLFGSVSQSVVLDATRPVTVTGAADRSASTEEPAATTR